MLRYYYINKEWMVSTTARRVYRVAAIFSLALFVVLVAVAAAEVLTGGIPATLLAAVRLCLLAGVTGYAVTMVAMEYFLFSFDRSAAWKKLFGSA
jgi:hypothetical protein